MIDPLPPSVAPLRFSVKLPVDARFLDLPRDLAAKIAAALGYAASDSQDTGVAVGRCVARAIARAENGGPDHVEVRFLTDGDRFEIQIVCAPNSHEAETLLSRATAGEGSLDIRIAEGDGTTCCRIVRALPGKHTGA